MATPSLKQIQIDKSSSVTFAVVAIAIFLTLFSLLSAKALYSRLKYQNKVIASSQTALNQLKSDNVAVNQLSSSYNKFITTSPNLIGGSLTGTASNDGNNAKIVLDALPSEFDFPAEAANFEALIGGNGITVGGVAVTDVSGDAGTGTAPAGSSATPIPVNFTIMGALPDIENALTTVQDSIQPVQIQTMMISGDQSALNIAVTGQTYYQPAKHFTIGSQEIN
jgi:hypothetical protein